MLSEVLTGCTDYSHFSFDPVSRPVVSSHVTRLEDEVADLYLLDLYPIVVTEDGKVIDGQHRFSMSRNLGIPFYYISGTDIDVGDISSTNRLTMRYSNEDAVDVFSSLGMDPYIYLKEISSKFSNVGLATIAEWSSSKYRNPDLLMGEYTVDRASYAERRLRVLYDYATIAEKTAGGKDRRSGHAWIYTSAAYRDAIDTLCDNPMYDQDRMMLQMHECPSRLIRCGTQAEAIFTLNYIFNYRIKGKNRVDLTLFAHRNREAGSEVEIVTTGASPVRGVPRMAGAVKIHCERNYSMFTVHPSSRRLRAVDELADSIRQKNLLRFYPIIVDSNFVVYDGQRRLAAAQKVGVPIYYIVANNISMWMIARAGGVAKRWSVRNYLNFWVKSGSSGYMELARYMDMYQFIHLDIFILLSDGGYKDARVNFRSGRFRLRLDRLEKVVYFLQRIRDSVLRSNFRFQRGVVSMVSQYGHKYEFISRMTDCVNQCNTIELLERRDDDSLIRYLVDKYNRSARGGNRLAEE